MTDNRRREPARPAGTTSDVREPLPRLLPSRSRTGAGAGRRSGRLVLGAVCGLSAGAAALGVAELAASAVRPQASPVVTVGGAVIDRTPPALKDFAVRHFGTNDKPVLESGIVVMLALFALTLGVAALRFRRSASAAVLVFGVVGVLAARSRPDRHGLDVLPPVVGAAVGTAVLWMLVGILALRGAPPASPPDPNPGPAPAADPAADAGPPSPPLPEPRSFDRRRFVLAATATATASAGAGLLGRTLNSRHGAAAAASRAAVVLPRPASPARAVPAGADLRVPGLSPFLTPNPAFYRVDTALVVPKVDATTWRLRLHGLGVRQELSLSYADLLRRDLIERDITLTCVSNEVGGPYVGNARWIGVRLADLLREAGVQPPSRGGPSDQLVARSVDGMTIGSPVETVMDGRDAMLAVGMNGEPLPFAHGFPVRVLVPGLYGYVSACKWLQELELTTFDAYDAYWVRRRWSRRAPIKTESRIDTPKPFATPKAGSVPVAGVAWAQHHGVDRVEVRVDGGAWHTARLGAQDSADTWRQWVWPWQATPGEHTLEVRATDREGRTQPEYRVGTLPDGATGWHSVVVTVT
ncbi:molybdopterin-dependent oxidoreductase [Actinacidiphila paucisporea]|uniref:DMSO/TMAO reductase YedYZ, molybdopterin-dependent catalytic subunit n=1 Tax=Actinacidiphila paucisporea TaxID=310782 RepID=A0A1M7NNT0_9ACTN|nr:molybdopterin-dependent oxidoreductase [Actinacidiphila paucisporea]SHN05196.1 DMSO/TMAO reductase YedYZ, molybdopterin-dependent catalytic subunit [Actinacidiphila paucisporea]